MISLIYSRERTLISWAIRLITWSQWSHVGIIDGDYVIESVPGHGVRRMLLAESVVNCERWQIVDYPCADPRWVINAAASQIGKPYDLRGALGLGLHRDWQDDARWWCSELVAWALQAAGEPWFYEDVIHRITPQHLWMRAPAQVVPEIDMRALVMAENRSL